MSVCMSCFYGSTQLIGIKDNGACGIIGDILDRACKGGCYSPTPLNKKGKGKKSYKCRLPNR